ncbi:hypothetical protein L596_022098 [Steinernema carpocapsae]|nr:hypothetical protein L596_022098 [Steinernema carpocapsae]
MSRKKLANEVLTENSAKYLKAKIDALKKKDFALYMDEYRSGPTRFVSYVSLFLDPLERTVFRVTTSFIEDKSWAMKTIRLHFFSLQTERATGDKLLALLRSTLERFGVGTENVIGVTRDGGANMVKVTELMNIPRQAFVYFSLITDVLLVFTALTTFFTSFTEKLSPTQLSSEVCKEFLSRLSSSFLKRRKEYDDNTFLKRAAFLDPRFVNRKELYTAAEWTTVKLQLIREHEENTAAEEEAVAIVAGEQDDDWGSLDEPLSSTSSSQIEKEIESYLAEERLPTPTPDNQNNVALLSFWKDKSKKYPILSSEARRALAVCASSAKPERVFSNLTHLSSNPKRTNLSDSTVEKLLTLNVSDVDETEEDLYNMEENED